MNFDSVMAIIIFAHLFIYGTMMILFKANPLRLGFFLIILLIITSFCSFYIYSAVNSSS